MLISSGMALLSKAGLDVPVAVLAGVPIGLTVFTVVVVRSRRLKLPAPVVNPHRRDDPGVEVP